jgi:hypothetical protein
MAAAFVCNTLNLPTDFENHAAYVSGWLKKLHEDKRELLRCCADAQKIAPWVLGYHPDFKAAHEPEPPRRYYSVIVFRYASVALSATYLSVRNENLLLNAK